MKHEDITGRLIGRFIRISNSKNKSLINLQGRVIDETRNTFIIQKDNRKIKIIKSQVKTKNENEIDRN